MKQSKEKQPIRTASKSDSGGKISKLIELPVWIPLVFFALTTVIFFWDQLMGNAWFWEDFAEYIFPAQSFAARESAGFSIPFWNPFTFCGMPFFADIQIGFFYPVNRLLNLFTGAGGHLPVGALQFVIILHFFIAQFSMYKLARYLKISSFGAVISAVSYAFSALFVCHVIHPMIVYHLTWFPLVLMFLMKGIEERRIRPAIYSGLLLGMTMLAGHPQFTLYESFFVGMMMIWLLAAEIKNKTIGNSFAKLAVAAIAPFVIAAGIFQVQYMPSQELAGYSVRSEYTYDNSAIGSLQLKQAFEGVVPKIFGHVDGRGAKDAPFYLTQVNNAGKTEPAPYFYFWETSFYFGLVALMLGIIGMAGNYKSKYGAFFITMAVFAFLYALGSNFFLHGLFYNLPMFGKFRVPSRMLFYVVAAFALFAGWGFDLILSKPKNRNTLISIFVAVGIPLIVSLLAAAGILGESFDVPPGITDKIQSFGTLACFFTLAGGVVIYFTYAKKLSASVSGVILAVLAVTDLNVALGGFNISPQNPEELYQLDPALEQSLKSNPPGDIFRVNMRMYKPSYMAMNRNQGLISRVALVEGYNPLLLKWTIPPLENKDKVHDALNVKYEINIDSATGYPRFFQRKTQNGPAWMVHRAVVMDENTMKSELKTGKYDLKKVVALEQNPAITLPAAPDSIYDDMVQCIEYGNNSMKFKVKSKDAGFVCFSEIWYPAWKGYVDGKETAIAKADYSLRAIPVQAGEHVVEMKYESDTFKSGMTISAITLLLSILGLVFGDFRRKSSPTTPEE